MAEVATAPPPAPPAAAADGGLPAAAKPASAAPPADLDAPFQLTQEQIEAYQRDGFVKLKGVLSPETLARYAVHIRAEVDKADKTPLEDDPAYAAAFVQIPNLWKVNPGCQEFSFGKRLARIAAELMQAGGVRIYHDQALFKGPGGGHTPWHCDQFYWPLGSDKTVTAWVPLVPVPEGRGPLQFAAGSQRHDLGRAVGIGSESDRVVGEAVKEGGFQVVGGPYELGDVSFHSGWTFHRADENTSDEWRNVMTVIYMDKDMVMTKPVNANQRRDSRDWLPGVKPGEVCAGPNNPLVWEHGSA